MRRLLQCAAADLPSPAEAGFAQAGALWRRRLALLFLLALILEGLAPPAHAAVAFVDASPACANPGSVSSFSITHTLTNGNAAVVIVAIRTTTSTVSTITDNGTGGGSTYRFRKAVNNGTVARVEIWSTTPTGITGSPTSITVNLSAASKVIGCSGQYSGVGGLGNVGTNTGSSTTPSHINRQVNANNIVVAGFSAQGTATFSANVGNLRRSATSSGGAAGSNVGGALNDNSSATAGAKVTNTVTLSATNSWAAASMELQGVAPSGDLLQIATPEAPAAITTVATFAIPNTAGKLILVCEAWVDQTVTASVADSNGNTYTSAVGPVNFGTNSRAQLFYAKNIVGGGSNQVTVTFSAAPTFPAMGILEYTNQDATAPLDVTASASGNSTAPDSGSATTNFANELIFGYCSNDATNPSAGATFTGREDSPTIYDMYEDKAVTSAAAYNATASLSATANWAMIMATFKNASQPGGAKKRLPLLGVG